MRNFIIGFAALFLGCLILACCVMVAYGNIGFCTGFVITVVAWLIYELVKKIRTE